MTTTAPSRLRSIPLPDRSTPNASARVVVRGMSRVFDGEDGPVLALDGVDITIEPGRFTVLVGPSGCGKTTLLRMIAGLDRPTSGSVETTRPDGRTPSNAVVFQGRSVFPWLSVRDNIGYGLKLAGARRRDRETAIARLVDVVGLGGFERAFPHQLSEGMRQRVAIARALAVDPDILLMDEPFGALDEQTRYLLQEELLRIWEQSRKTVVFITHSIDEALTLADEVVVMGARPGRILQRIPVPFERPRTMETVRSDPRFAVLFNQIWDGLRSEVLASRQRAPEGVR